MVMDNKHVSRRSLIKTGLFALGAAATGPITIARGEEAQQPSSPASAAKRILRFAHPTDIHVQPERRGAEGMAAAFRHMMSMPDPPTMIITGGDLPMDTASTPYDRSKIEWDLFRKVLADSVPSSMPIYHTIGNHDVFGRDKE